jgi:hypothetical protein
MRAEVYDVAFHSRPYLFILVGGFIVIRYTCDRCKRDIDPSTDLRYTVTVEIEAAGETDVTDVVDEVDHLEELQEMLQASDEICASVFDDDLYQRKQFDLCKCCFQQYIRNPLARDPSAAIGYSKN